MTEITSEIPVLDRLMYRNKDCNAGFGVSTEEDEGFYKFFSEYEIKMYLCLKISYTMQSEILIMVLYI